jgi:hypothetical protein
MNNTETITSLPVPLKGGRFTQASGDVAYVEPWNAWWLAKLWQGRLLPEHTRWEANVDRADLARDYLAWAREHCEIALYSVDMEYAMFWTCGLYKQDWEQKPLVFLGPLDYLRSKWDNKFFPMRWPEFPPTPAIKPTTRRPFNFSRVIAPQGELLAA